MTRELRVLEPSALRQAASVTDEVAAERWKAALSRPDEPGPALVSLLDDWGEFAGIEYRDMLGDILDAQARIDSQWREREPTDSEQAAAFYDDTDTLTPLLLWWHGTDLNPARCATGAAAVMGAVGGRQALDFGCGIGSTALVLAAAGAEVLLADVAEEPLRFAEWRLRLRGYEPTSLRLLEQPLEEIEPGSCDCIVAFDVFEHLPDPYPSLEQLDWALAQGGVFCVNQVYVPTDDEVQHYPQRGEVLRWLHGHGYRLAHIRGVCWVAQKASLRPAARARQGLALRSRIAATHIANGHPGPLRRRLAHRAVRALR